MALTVSATTGSTATLGTITNTFGTITGSLPGGGTIDATALTADDITLTEWSSGTASDNYHCNNY